MFNKVLTLAGTLGSSLIHTQTMMQLMESMPVKRSPGPAIKTRHWIGGGVCSTLKNFESGKPIEEFTRQQRRYIARCGEKERRKAEKAGTAVPEMFIIDEAGSIAADRF